MHDNSLLMFNRHGREHVAASTRVLEIGPDGIPSSYRQSLGSDAPAVWHTADVATSTDADSGRSVFGQHGAGQLDHVLTDPYRIPVADSTYDCVLSGQVAEHVPEVWRWFGELARVVTPGGVVVSISPVSWPYHEAPVDCWRIYPEGMRALHSSAGLVTELARWESLEPPPSRRTFPGTGAPQTGAQARLAPRLRRLVGWPTPVAVDLISVGRRPVARRPSA